MKFRESSKDFSRERALTLEHTVGLIMSMTLSRNGNGYDISAQNYFRELNSQVQEKIQPVRHQSVSEARGKLKWQGFEYLLGAANLESNGLPEKLKFKGHVTRAVDGTSFYVPLTDDLLEHFSQRNTKSEEGKTHYPYGLCVTAVNVFTGQPVAASVDDYRTSERDLLKRLMAGFSRGDLSLLDRGLGGKEVYFEYHCQGQYFIHRSKTTGERVASYIQEFLESGRKQKEIRLTTIDKASSRKLKMKLRLILGPIDSEGKPIVFVTNLINKTKYRRIDIILLYRRRWGAETLYNRVKNLLCLEKFHAKSYNGIMQEIFANLLALSLAAVAVGAVVQEDKLDPEVELPNFKNATEVVRRHLFTIIDERITGQKSKSVVKQILKEVRAVMYKVRPNRSYARVSMQPIQSWNLKKSAKLKAFAERKGA
jgi:hypothetical protein